MTKCMEKRELDVVEGKKKKKRELLENDWKATSIPIHTNTIVMKDNREKKMIGKNKKITWEEKVWAI